MVIFTWYPTHSLASHPQSLSLKVPLLPPAAAYISLLMMLPAWVTEVLKVSHFFLFSLLSLLPRLSVLTQLWACLFYLPHYLHTMTSVWVHLNSWQDDHRGLLNATIPRLSSTYTLTGPPTNCFRNDDTITSLFFLKPLLIFRSQQYRTVPGRGCIYQCKRIKHI